MFNQNSKLIAMAIASIIVGSSQINAFADHHEGEMPKAGKDACNGKNGCDGKEEKKSKQSKKVKEKKCGSEAGSHDSCKQKQ